MTDQKAWETALGNEWTVSGKPGNIEVRHTQGLFADVNATKVSTYEQVLSVAEALKNTVSDGGKGYHIATAVADDKGNFTPMVFDPKPGEWVNEVIK